MSIKCSAHSDRAPSFPKCLWFETTKQSIEDCWALVIWSWMFQTILLDNVSSISSTALVETGELNYPCRRRGPWTEGAKECAQPDATTNACTTCVSRSSPLPLDVTLWHIRIPSKTVLYQFKCLKMFWGQDRDWICFWSLWIQSVPIQSNQRIKLLFSNYDKILHQIQKATHILN